MTLPNHKTKIVCTIGPASKSLRVMEQLLLAGMNVARINFSHGDFSSHGQVMADLRQAARNVDRRLAIMADLPGPKIRIGILAEEPIELAAGQEFVLTTAEITGNPTRVSVSFEPLPRVVQPGNRIYLNDGLIELEVQKTAGEEVTCRVLVGGELRSRKGLNLPGIDLGINAFTAHDRDCLKFALEHEVDAVSQSFVESAADIEALRRAASDAGSSPFVIAKIERSRALGNLEEIFQAADGIMVARGDLGVEVPIEQVPVIQKQLMHQANVLGKPVITATQMLESMTSSRRPTRAEATDVANAILDGTDCVMLSAESATGMFPVEAVTTLAKIADGHRAAPFRVPGPGNSEPVCIRGQNQPGGYHRLQRGISPGTDFAGSDFCAHPQRCHRPQPGPFSPAQMDRGGELRGVYLPAAAVQLRRLSGVRAGPSGRLEFLYPELAQGPRSRGRPGDSHRGPVPETAGHQQSDGDH